MSIAGYTTMTINGESTAKWGTRAPACRAGARRHRFDGVGGKMTALKSATKNLINQLKAAATNNGDVYVSIIPFNKDVNVGIDQTMRQNWIDWTQYDATNSGGSSTQGRSAGTALCGISTVKAGTMAVRAARTAAASARTARSGSSMAAGTVPAACNHMTWNGCVSDRGDILLPSIFDYDRKTTAPSTSIKASLWPAEQYGSCPEEMMGLTYDWAALNALVDKLEPDGNTNQPIGLVWAWQSLVGGGPLTAPSKNANYTYNEVIVLMSDGLNTQNRWTKNQTLVDKRMYDASLSGQGTCKNIKATGVTIYAVHVNTDGQPKSTLMENCASGTDKFWMITSAGDLSTVFSKIGTDVTKLRVAK